MLNSGKHFLSGLLNRFSNHQGRRSWFSKGSVDHLRARHLSMEPLEDRQLLAVTGAEISSLAQTYSALGVSTSDNFIEIVNEKLNVQELRNAIDIAAKSAANDVIVLRTRTEGFTLDLGNTPLVIDVPVDKGNLCVLAVGEQPLRLTAQAGTVIRIDSGSVGLGNMLLVGDQAEGTTTPLIETRASALLATQDVNFTVQTYWTKSLPNNGRAYITLCDGIYSVDWSANGTTNLRSFVTGLKSEEQVYDLLGLNYTSPDPVFHEDPAYIDADIDNIYGVDTNLMWAGSAADLLNYTGWGHIVSSNEDTVYQYFVSNFTNDKYYVEGAVQWFMNGQVGTYSNTYEATTDDKGTVVTPASGDIWSRIESDGGNLYGSKYQFSDYGGTFDSRTYYDGNARTSPLKSVAEMLKSGYGIATNLSSYITTTTIVETTSLVNGEVVGVPTTTESPVYDYRFATNALTIWGYVYDTTKTASDTGYYVSIYATDPSDDALGAASPNKLQKYDISWTATTDKRAGLYYTYRIPSLMDVVETEPEEKLEDVASTDGARHQTRTVTRVVTATDYRMKSFVYLAMAEGYAPVGGDLYEPNNSRDEVDARTDIDTPTNPSPNLGIVNGEKVIENLTLVDYEADPSDWFKFETLQSCSVADYVAVDYETTLFSGHLKLYLYTLDAQGNLVWLEDRVFTREVLTSTDIYGNGANTYRVKLSMMGLARGTYYAVVRRAEDLIDCKNYKLILQTCGDDPYEVNNTRSQVDAAPEGGVDSPNLGPIFGDSDTSAEVEKVLSGLVLKQSRPVSVSSSEVDGFRFVMTGTGGPNSYIELRYDHTRYSLNDSDLELYLYSRLSDEYYREVPSAWGKSVADSTENEDEGVERVSLNGLPAGIYYVKVVGYVNAENILDYKLVFHMRDETDPPGVGVTDAPDYYVAKPDLSEVPYDWESPLIVTSQEYSTYNPEKTGADTFYGETFFYSQDIIRYNLSFAVTGRKDDDVKVGYYLNGTLIGEEILDFEVGQSTKILTDRALAHLTEGHFLTANDGKLWEGIDEWTGNWEDGMILSVINSQNLVTSGYVYMNGNFIGISDTTELPDGVRLTLDDGTSNGMNVVYYKTKLVESGFSNSITKTSTPVTLSGYQNALTYVSKEGSYAVSYNAIDKEFTILIPGELEPRVFEPRSGSIFIYGDKYLVYVKLGTQDLFYEGKVNSTAQDNSKVYDGVFRSDQTEYITGESVPLTMLTATGSRSVLYNSKLDKFVDSAKVTVTVASGTVFSYYDAVKDETRYLTYVPRSFTGTNNEMTMIDDDGNETLVTFDATRNRFKNEAGNLINVAPGTHFSYTDEEVKMTYFKEGRFIEFFESYVDLSCFGKDKPGESGFDVSERTLTTRDGLVLIYYKDEITGGSAFYALSNVENGTVMVDEEGQTLYFQGILQSHSSEELYKGYDIGDAMVLRDAPETYKTNLWYNSIQLEFRADGSLYDTAGNQKSIPLGTILTWKNPDNSQDTRGVLYQTDLSGETSGKKLYVSRDEPLDSNSVLTVGENTFLYRKSNFYAEYTKPTGETRFTYDVGTVAETEVIYDPDTDTFKTVSTYPTTFTTELGETLTWYGGKFAKTYTLGDAAAFFPDGTRFVFYKGNGHGTSYIKITPSIISSYSDYVLYTNNFSFAVDCDDKYPEYIETNNTSSASFNVFRYQDDHFIPNGTLEQALESTNPTSYLDNPSDDPNVKYNPNLGPIISEQVIEHLALMTSEDWFTFEIQGDTTDDNYVQITFDQKLGDLDLYVYKKDSNYSEGYFRVGFGAGVGNTETVYLKGYGAGTYYVKVVGFQGATNPDYNMTIFGPLPIEIKDKELVAGAKPINNSALITWNLKDAPEDYVFGGPEEYFSKTEIRYWKEGQTVEEAITVTADRYADFYTLTNLDSPKDPDDEEVVYYYQVRALNARYNPQSGPDAQPSGATAWTDEATFTVKYSLNAANYYALIIGASDYASYDKLNSAYTDAKGVEQALINAAPQWSKDNITVLAGAITKDDVTKALNEMTQGGHAPGANDVVFVYYAGRGSTRNVAGEVTSYINTYSGTYSQNEFATLINGYFADVAQLDVVLNPYYFVSGSSNDNFNFTGFGDEIIDAFSDSNTLVSVITAADNGENTRTDADGNDYFGEYMISALSEQVDGWYVADTNHDGRVSFQEIYDYVYNNVRYITATFQNPQFLPENQAKDSVVIKGDWTESDNNYEYFADQWWNASSIVVTTNNDVVDATDGEISLREAIDILGTVLLDETILFDETKILYGEKTEPEKFVYTQNQLQPGDKFSIGDVDYTYKDGLRYNLLGQTIIVQEGDQFIWTYSKSQNTGLVTITETVTVERDEHGYFIFKNSQGIVDPYANVTGNVVTMTLADGSNTRIALSKCGLKEQELALDTISFDVSLTGKTFALDKERDFLDISDDNFERKDAKGYIDSITINGNSLDNGVHFVRGDNTAPKIIISSSNAADKVVSLVGLVMDGTALENQSGNVYLINSLFYDNDVAIVNESGATLHVTNSTISANATGIDNKGELIVANSIVFGNTTDIVNTGTKTVDYSLIETGHDYTDGTGNLNPEGEGISLETIFTDFAARDFTLNVANPASPVINAASAPLAVDANGLQLPGDLAGNARKLYGGVDMGAYEWYDPTLTVSTTVTTMFEDYEVDEEVVSLREAISYAGSWFKSVKTLDSLEGETFSINGVDNIYAEGGSFQLHRSGFYVAVSGEVIELKAGDRLRYVASNEEIIFTGTDFVDTRGYRVHVPEHGESVMYYTSETTYVPAHYSAYLSVAFTNYENGDSIYCYADGRTGTIIEAPDGTISISKTVVLGNTIYFDLVAMRNDWLKRDRTRSEVQWYEMLDSQGIVFKLDSYTDNVRAGAIVIDTHVTIDGSNTINEVVMPKGGFVVTPAEDNVAFIIDVTSAIPTVTFNYFNFAGANLTGDAIEQNGGQILVRSGEVGIANAKFTNNHAVEGGAIYVDGGTVTIDASEFSENSATNGGAIAIGAEGTVTVNNSVQVFRNKATTGGAFYNEGTLTLTGFSSKRICVYDNEANQGGAIYNAGTLTAKYVNSYNENETTGNRATANGGFLYNAPDGKATIYSSNIYYNTAVNGGGVYNAGGLILDAVDLGGNHAKLGGGLYDATATDNVPANGYSATIVNSILRGNEAADNGGAIYVSSNKIRVFFSTIAGNVASNGGGIYVDTSASLQLDNSVVANNWLELVDKKDDIKANNTDAVHPEYSFISIGDFDRTAIESKIGTMTNPADPEFIAMEHADLSNIRGWESWILSSTSDDIVERGDATNITYKSFDNKDITVLYDFTGRKNRRIVKAEGVYVTDMGAYETGKQQETPSTKVTTLEYILDPEDGLISLYEAIIYAGPEYLQKYPSTCTQQITFDESLNGGTITVGRVDGDDKPGTQYSLVLSDSYEIYVAPGQNITLQGNQTVGCFGSVIHVTSEADVTITGLNITGGRAYVDKDKDVDEANGAGGAINMSGGKLVLQDLSIFDNASQKSGGAIYQYGGQLSLTNVLISENTTSNALIYEMHTMGGAIRSTKGVLEINGCTITKNVAPNYGGVYVDGASMTMYNTIIADNTEGVGSSGDLYCKGMKNNIFHSLIGVMKDASAINGINGNLAGTAVKPKDAGFDDYVWSINAGGKITPPKAPLKDTSPAINAGSNRYVYYSEGEKIETDLYGNPRIRASVVDMGVFESGVLDPIGTTVTTLLDIVDPNDELLSIREAINNAKDDPTATIKFAISEEQLAENGGLYTIRLKNGAIDLSLDSSITIDARENNGVKLANGITFDAHYDSRIFNVSGNQNLTLYNLVLTGGQAANGGAIYSDSIGQVRMVNCVVYGNSTEMHPDAKGGAIYQANGSLELLNCTVAGNTTTNYGAVYTASGVDVTLHNSIISDNRNDVGGEGGNYDFVGDVTKLKMVTSLIGSLSPELAKSSAGNACIVGTPESPVSAGFIKTPAFAINSPHRVVNLDGPTDLSLSSTSRAVNSGTNVLVGRPGYSSKVSKIVGNTSVISYDLMGSDRIIAYTVDMGAYECTTPVNHKPSIVVNTLDDLEDNPYDNFTTLREAIKNAGMSYVDGVDENGKDIVKTLGRTVTFATELEGGTLHLTHGAIVIDKTVSIDASNLLLGGVTISADGNSRVFEVLADSTDKIGMMGLKLTGGYAEVTRQSTAGGGAIYHTGGDLTIINSLLYDNEALKGGAIQSEGGSLKLVNVTITKNNAFDATLPAEEELPETKIKGGYGAIYSVNGNIELYNTLVALNTYNAVKIDDQWDTKANLANLGCFTVEIFANKKSYNATMIGVVRTIDSVSGDENGNMSGNPYVPLDPVFEDWDSNNFSLGRDANRVNSPAINAGQSAFAFDLNGNTIVTDLAGGHRFVEQIDLGAFETYNGATEIPSTIVTTNLDIVNNSDGLISLREAINYASTGGLGSVVTFMESLTGKTFYLNEKLVIDKTITIDGESLGTDITITLADEVTDQGVICINSGDVHMLNLVITNRYTERAKAAQTLTVENGGGIEVRTGNLFLYNCLLYDNYAANGAAIYIKKDSTTSSLNLINTTITDNWCPTSGDTVTGAVVHDGAGIVNIQNSIIARNQTHEAVKGTKILPQYSFLDYAPDVKAEEGHGMFGNYIGYDAIKDKMAQEAQRLFVDWENDDFHLADIGLATNGGKNSFTLYDNKDNISYNGLINMSGVDLNGNRRLVGQTVDMGAYENQVATDVYCWRDSTDGSPVDEDWFKAVIEQSNTNLVVLNLDIPTLRSQKEDANIEDLLNWYNDFIDEGKVAQSLLWYLRTYIQNAKSGTLNADPDKLDESKRVKIIDVYTEKTYEENVLAGYEDELVNGFKTWLTKNASGSKELALLNKLILQNEPTEPDVSSEFNLGELSLQAWGMSDKGKEKAELSTFISTVSSAEVSSLNDLLAYVQEDVEIASFLVEFIEDNDSSTSNAKKMIRNKLVVEGAGASDTRFQIWTYRLKDALESVVGKDHLRAHKALAYMTVHGLDPDSRILITTNLDVVTAQDGVISLREAVSRAERLYDIILSKPIEFATYSSVLAKNSTMVLGVQTISINRPVVIDASMVNSFRIDGNNMNNIFRINTADYPDEEVRLVNFELFNGSASNGGAIFHTGGNLVLLNSLIHTNEAKYPSSAATAKSYGGGIYSRDGYLTLVNCTVANNRADFGGGIYATSSPKNPNDDPKEIKESAVFLYNTIVAKNIINNAQDKTDVDIVVSSASDSDLEMAYSFVGNSDSLKNLDGVNGNIVGFGYDHSRDPYFVNINEGNFRLQPRIVEGGTSVPNPAAVCANISYVNYFDFRNDLDGYVIDYGSEQINAEKQLKYLGDKGFDPDDPESPSPETRPYSDLTDEFDKSRSNDMVGQKLASEISDNNVSTLDALKSVYFIDESVVTEDDVPTNGGTIQMKDTYIVMLYYLTLYQKFGEQQDVSDADKRTWFDVNKEWIVDWYVSNGYDTYQFDRSAATFEDATDSFIKGSDGYNSAWFGTYNKGTPTCEMFIKFLEKYDVLDYASEIITCTNGLVESQSESETPLETIGQLQQAAWAKVGLGYQGETLLEEINATGITENDLNAPGGLNETILEWNKEKIIANALELRITYNSKSNNERFVVGTTLYTRRLKDALTELVTDPKVSMGAYQLTKETPSPIVTTVEDVVDPYDGMISLREAVLYATFDISDAITTADGISKLTPLSLDKSRTNRRNTFPDVTTDGARIPYNAVGNALVDYQKSVSIDSYYSKEERIVNYWKITFADDLAGKTITLNPELGQIDMYGFGTSYRLGNVSGGVFYYLIDASSINRQGGITIDANNVDYIFDLHGNKNATLDLLQVVYSEFEGLRLTGASEAAIHMDEYCVAEVRNSLLYRNDHGIKIDDITATKYYGVVHVFNSTVVNNTDIGIQTGGKAFVYNSIVALNGTDVVLQVDTSQPAWRQFVLYNSMYNTSSAVTTSGSGLNNIRVSNPLFVDEANDDYRLTTYSLAINTGDGDYLAINRPTHAEAQADLNGMERTQGGHVDMGCFENTYIADVPSTVVTLADYYIDPETGQAIRDAEGNLVFNEAAAKAINENAIVTSGDVVDPTDGYISLREAITWAEQYQYYSGLSGFPNLNTNKVTFSSLLKDSVITLTGGAIMIVNDITIDATARGTNPSGDYDFFQPGITINVDNNHKSGIFHVDIANSKYGNTIVNSKLNVKFIGLNLTGGVVADDGGAVYITSGNVLVENSAIYGNKAGGHGGAIYIANYGKTKLVNGTLQEQSNELTVRGSRITGNFASHYGGVVSNQGVVRFENSIVAENKASTPGADYDFYYETIANANGYGSKNSRFGKTRNIALIGGGSQGDSNWIGFKDDEIWNGSQEDIDNIFTGHWEDDTWVGDATVDRDPLPYPKASASAAAFAAAASGDESFFDDLLIDY